MLSENWSAWQVLNQLFAFYPNNTSASAVFSGQVSDAAFRTLIYYFNVGILMAVIAIYAFILVIGTINTAKDGTFLGKNWSSYWIPLRVILGSTFAIPLQSGFCMAQYLIFLMVSVSIQFANDVWKETYTKLDQNKVPPVMSYDIADGVKTDLALYLLAGFSSDMLTKLASKANGDDRYDAYDTPKVDQMSIVQAAMKIENNISQQMRDNIDEVDDIYKTTDNKLNTANIERLKQGMQQWSILSGDSYEQYYIYKIINHYIFRLPVSQPDNTDVSKALSTYCYAEDDGKPILGGCYNLINRILDMHKQSLSISYLFAQNQTTIGDLAQSIAKGFQSQLKEKAENPGQSNAAADVEQKERENDWWNADQKYFKLDSNFESVLQAFHKSFAVFDDLLYNDQQSQIDISKVGIKLQYLKNSKSLGYLVDNAINGSLNYSIHPDISEDEKDPQHSKEVKLTDFMGKDKTDKFIQLDLSKLKQQMMDVLGKDVESCKTTYKALFGQDMYIIKDFNCKSLIDAIIPSSISSDIGKYFLVIQTALDNSKQGADIEDKKKKYVEQFLYLVRLFQLNHVSFFHEGAVVADIASPAEQFINEIFQKMSLDANAGGILNQIYNIGESVSPGASVENAFSALTQIQGVGQSLIKMVVDTLIAITKKANKALNDVKWEVGTIQGVSKSAALGAAVSSYFTPGLPGVISSIGDFGAQLATFITMTNLTMSLIWLPLVFFVLVTLFTNAVLFALIIPLTPFILFWAGKIAWLLLIIEALVAAPVVALGLVYPEGHEVYGKAEPAIQIMLNLVLRPVLMICGLITGIILTYLVIAISAKGFHAVATQISNVYGTSSDSYVTGSLNILLIFMYASFISLAFYKCFSLIYILPDKILHWVGGTHNERAGEQDMQEMKSSSMQNAQGMAQSGTQTVEKHNQGRQEQMHGVQNLGASAGHVGTSVDNYKYHKSQKGGGESSGGNGAHLSNPVNPNKPNT
ncbi:DotA/TraY family protein [Cysteiniphilum sp. QT6929]|uniref:DotA/TraY family protein n=1 Tax=Cysteiniphilum sp. QT6929 TaxID=2975055 RepID=UPI0024B38FBB|nr:DotA/TraY family protein [Cysteiniphilum sp. QT6929]WHN64850.1 DotA/TraY family protein [Cysteiniphilum sp. QT6929]